MARSPRFSFPMPTDETLRLIPQKLAERFKLLPIRRTASTLTVVTSNPQNVRMLQDLERQFGLTIDARQVSEEEMGEALAYAFGPGNSGLANTSTQTLIQTPSPPPAGDPSPAARKSLSGSHRVPTPPGGLQSLDAPEGRANSSSGGFEVPSLAGISAEPNEGRAGGFEDTLGNLDDLGLDPGEVRPDRTRPDPEDGLAALVIERARAQDDSGVSTSATPSVSEAPAGEQIRDMLLTAVRMGASEIFLDCPHSRVLLRARIGFRSALLHEFDAVQGGLVLANLRTMAGVGAFGDEPGATARAHLQFEGGLEADFFLRAFATSSGESVALDVVKYPGWNAQALQPRGIGPGSPTKLRDHLATRLGDKRLASVVTKQLTREPSMLAVVAPRARNREAMLALLAGALAGPSLGQRVVYAGERPRYYLDDQGVVLLPCVPDDRMETYKRAARLGGDYSVIEECASYEELALATEASVGQHVIVGIPGADPIDILVFLTEAPEPRRLAQRLGSILFIDAQSMKIVEMNQPLREAVGSMEDAGTFVQMFEGQAQTAGPRPTTTEVPAMADPFKGG